MPCKNDGNARPHTDTGVGVPTTLGPGAMPMLEPIGEAVGRVLTRRAGAGRVTVTLGGHAVVVNRGLSHLGSFTYAGDPKWFTGELALTFTSRPGTELVFRGHCVGRHLGSRLAVIQSVGTFEPGDSMRLVEQIVVAEITVVTEATYEARFYRVVPAGSARKVPNALLRAFGSGIVVH